MHRANDIKVKICMVGDSSVGKTSLVKRYVLNVFDEKFISSIGSLISKKSMKIEKLNMDILLTLSIWDVLGGTNSFNDDCMAFEGAKGALLVCDLTRKDTMMNLSDWVTRLRTITGNIPLLLLANKSDLTNEYQFEKVELKSLAEQLNAPFYFTSAKSGDNVWDTFFKLGDLILDNIFTGSGDKIQKTAPVPSLVQNGN